MKIQTMGATCARYDVLLSQSRAFIVSKLMYFSLSLSEVATHVDSIGARKPRKRAGLHCVCLVLIPALETGLLWFMIHVPGHEYDRILLLSVASFSQAFTKSAAVFGGIGFRS